jgi:hypothetical protein
LLSFWPKLTPDCDSTWGDLGELGTFSRREAVPSNLEILADLVISANAHNAVRARSLSACTGPPYVIICIRINSASEMIQGPCDPRRHALEAAYFDRLVAIPSTLIGQ